MIIENGLEKSGLAQVPVAPSNVGAALRAAREKKERARTSSERGGGGGGDHDEDPGHVDKMPKKEDLDSAEGEEE